MELEFCGTGSIGQKFQFKCGKDGVYVCLKVASAPVSETYRMFLTWPEFNTYCRIAQAANHYGNEDCGEDV